MQQFGQGGKQLQLCVHFFFFFTSHCFESHQLFEDAKLCRLHFATEIFASGLSVNSTQVTTSLILFWLTLAFKE